MAKNGCHPNVVTFSTLINGYIKANNIDEVVKVFQEMPSKGIVPDVVTYNNLVDGLCKANRLQLARQLFNEMQVHGNTPDTVTYTSLLDGLCKMHDLMRQCKYLKRWRRRIRGLSPIISSIIS